MKRGSDRAGRDGSRKLFGMRPSAAAALTGILASLTLVLSLIEKLLLAAVPLPLGAKLGLANVAVMFALTSVGFLPALVIVVIKSAFAFLVSGGAAAVMSISGGLLSLLVMYLGLLIRRRSGAVSYIGVSVLSACAHNIGQLTAASLISGTDLFPTLTGPLLIFGVVFGAITGTVLNIIMPSLSDRLKKY